MELSSWLSPKTEKSLPSKIHKLGFFAKEDIKKGEIIAIKSGCLISKNDLANKPKRVYQARMQIDDDIYLAPKDEEEVSSSMIYVNHSCEPNLSVSGQIIFIAIKDINQRDELTVDYGTAFADDLEMKCNCGSKNCRGIITGNDWKDKKIQNQYGDNFSWFILQKIKEKSRQLQF
jgi:hypothetical protein